MALLAVKLLREQYGDPTFAAVIGRLRCKGCGKPPAPVHLIAGRTREYQGGEATDWAIEIVPRTYGRFEPGGKVKK